MSFDAHEILVERWAPTYKLLAARFSADLKELIYLTSPSQPGKKGVDIWGVGA